MPERDFLMDAKSLCSKWGFSDGEALADWWWDTYDEDAPANSDDILHALVLEYLVPAMRAAGWFPVLCRVETNHNPVRAESLNGVGVGWYDGIYPNFDPPISVSVTRAQVEQIAQRLTLIELTPIPTDLSLDERRDAAHALRDLGRELEQQEQQDRSQEEES